LKKEHFEEVIKPSVNPEFRRRYKRRKRIIEYVKL
jgi:hypothetical protein